MVKKIITCVLTAALLITAIPAVNAQDYIKWIDFDVSAEAMNDALEFCTAGHTAGTPCSFTELLACLAVKYGGNFAHYKKADLTSIGEALQNGEDPIKIVNNEKLYQYYSKAYDAVLGGMVGEYTEYTVQGDTVAKEDKYGLIAYSPIAQGYSYSHSDDFGAARSYGYKRNHLGHDLMGSVGTPVVAVEGGYVEACGWNQYGGWRIGIRSYDGKRYYYYAHLRKGHPYNDIYEGKQIDAGEVIGYLGMTGYSAKEDTNNINTPHLHYGLQIIFDPSQKDGWNQIWIDMYALTKFLYQNRAPVVQTEDGERVSTRWSVNKQYPD